MRYLSNFKNPKKKILFLGYNEKQTQIINTLIDKNCSVDHTNKKMSSQNGYDFIICYGYRHILNQDIIRDFKCPIFNLHISFLPYNRGAHPNFWSFYDNTPVGVTIHLIDEGIDTGPVISQKYVNFKNEDNTFSKTYLILRREIENLFLECVDKLLNDKWKAKKQNGVGSHHFKKDLPSNFSGWDSNIKKEIARLKKEGLRYD